jgi:uncharacterized protein (TIRG00374 family)
MQVIIPSIMGGLIFLLIVPSLQSQFQSIIRRIIPKESWNIKILSLLESFIQGFSVLRDVRRIALFVLLTVVIWLIDGFGTVITALVIQQTLSLPHALVLLAGLGLSSALPSTPGYVGVYQFVAVMILVPFGFTQSEALAYILLSQIVGYLVVTFWGCISIWKISR